MSKDKPKYDFYENNMFLDDPLTADINRKESVKGPKIGTEPRVNIRQDLYISIDAYQLP